MNATSSQVSEPHRSDAELLQYYTTLQAGLPEGPAVTLLHIGAEHTAVVSGSQLEAAVSLTLDIGYVKTARDHFRHVPPTGLELENAIAAVEDELARARSLVAGGSRLFSTDVAIRAVALNAGLADCADLTLSQEATERTFSRLAAVAQGSSAAHEGIPPDAAFAATLLILREFLHHLQFAAITVTA